jgi:hypothetical protein
MRTGKCADLRTMSIPRAGHGTTGSASLKIGKDTAVLLCTDIDFGGPCIFFSGDGQRSTDIISLHGTGWEDRISSMKVRARGWTPWSESGGSSGGSQEREEPEVHGEGARASHRADPEAQARK